MIETVDRLAVSAIDGWEVAWLARRGRLDLGLRLTDWSKQVLAGSSVTCFPIDQQIAVRAGKLPEHHRDPTDPVVIAVAIKSQVRLTSLDSDFVCCYACSSES